MSSTRSTSFERPVPKKIALWMKVIFCVALLALTYQSVVPASGSPSITHFDKIMHAGAYAVLASLLALALPRLQLVWVILFPALYGAGLEVAQSLTPYGRTGSIYDGLANALGAVFVVTCWGLWIKLRNHKNSLKTPIR